MVFSIFKRKVTEALTETDIPHNTYFNALIDREYQRVIDAGHTYLDFTGGNLYAQSQLEQHFQLLRKNVLGNPHSTNPTSKKATELAEETRQGVLDFFNASDNYFCIFTQNASTSLKIIGECYPFDQNGFYLLLADNHNSVNGIREYCTQKGGDFAYCPIQYDDLKVDGAQLEARLTQKSDYTNKLFAYPAQSNVSGVKHSLAWIDKAHKNGWDVLLDAAAFVPSSPLDLSDVKPDFVSVSFYKIFGYPTGIGCLLVRKDKFEKLVKPWFAGGTVTLASVKAQHHYLAKDHERFENGTINYLDLPAVKIGLDYISSIGMNRIQERVCGLINYLYSALKDITYTNGQHVVKLFGPSDRSAEIGGTLIMNFYTSNGELYPFEAIESQTNARNISIRSGCFCNPGIDEVNNSLSPDELSSYFSDRKEGDYRDMIEFLNKMRGATRVSVGIATRKKDLDTFIAFVNDLRSEN